MHRTLLIIVLACSATSLSAQEPAPGLISESSNLYAVLPAGEWSSVESSVDRGLAWLATTQEEDGRFPSEDSAQPAVTSMAIMAFLSRGHVPDEGRYGAQLSKAIDFVLSTQRRRGYFCLLPVSPSGGGHMSTTQTVTYNHAIAGLMLGEVYGMTSGERSQKIETAITSALIYHREVQTRVKEQPTDIGGFRYGYPEGPNASSDMSVTGWALMFLRSARNAEFNVPKEYYDEGLDFVERCYEKDTAQHTNGVFRYRPFESEPGSHQITLANTASAMLTLMLGGRHQNEGIATGAAWFRSRPYPRPWQDGYFYLSTYYSSQAMAQVGGETWNQVFPQIARSLLQEQTANGSWPLGGGTERTLGATYSTSLAILSLTPAYQLLPIYQR